MRTLFFLFCVGVVVILTSGPALADCPVAANGTTIPSPQTRHTGAIIYNSDYDVLQACREDGSWLALHGMDAPTGCDNIGQVCSDGSVYAGMSPDGAVRMYTTPADASSLYKWNNGSSNWIDTGLENCSARAPGPEEGCRTGRENTAFLVALADAAAPYAAAAYCEGLSVHGRDDWYLPAQDELYVLYENSGAIGGFTASDLYWSSSEDSDTNARVWRFDGTIHTNTLKSNDLRVRCVRR